MKSYILAATILLSAPLSGQIVFEEVSVLPDFSLSHIWKSPSGEFFVESYGDRFNIGFQENAGIYSSPDGLEWIRKELPETHSGIEDIQFFDDGTPVARTITDEHVIRRGDEWYYLRIPMQQSGVETTFIRDDTLFAYGSKKFAYSIDKGITFTTLFTVGENIIIHSAHVWASDKYLALHHSVGSTDYLSVFNRSGERVFVREIDFYINKFLHASCDEVLMVGFDEYFSFSLVTMEVSEGSLQAIHPDFDYDTPIQTQDGYYYLLAGQTLWRSPGCAWAWEEWLSDPMLDSFDHCRVIPGEGILLYSTRRNEFVERTGGTSEWHTVPISEHAPHLRAVDEASQGFQAAVTDNAFFLKVATDTNWMEGEFPPMSQGSFQYGPDGRLYMPGDSSIYVSVDNGLSFDTLPLPPMPWYGPYYYDLRVLSDEVFFIWDYLEGQIYYSLDGGGSWREGPESYPPLGSYKVRLAGHYIIVAELDINIRLMRINLANGEVKQVGLNVGDGSDYYSVEISEDGSVYYLRYSALGLGDSGLFQYRFNGLPEYLGYTSEFSTGSSLLASRNVIFGFGTQSGYAFDGDALFPMSYIGLPPAGSRRFQISTNQHAYVIIQNSRIFRSVEPLTYAQNLSGQIAKDANEDCMTDSLDMGLKGWQVVAEGGQYIRVRTTDANGHYQFNLPAGDYIIKATPVNSNWMLCASTYPVTVDVGEQGEVPGFSAIAASDCASLDLDFSTPLLRRCFDNSYSIRVRNTGPGASAGTQLRLELDPFYDFISATHPYTMDGDSILLFDLGVLEVNAEVFIQVIFNLSCDADLGMTHCLGGHLLDNNLCGNERSAYTECQQNIGSYDPNDKRTFNAAGRETQTVDKDEYIYYHIRFQNTGTDTAFRVRILDTLSNRLDPRTLEMLSASHPFTHAVNDGPTLEVVFDNIFLPDSNVNEAASHGFFKFRIKPYPQYDYGTMIPNDASIYFDYNDPVITPEALLVLQQPVRTSEPAPSLSFNLTPNPASDWIAVRPNPDSPVQPDGYRIVDRLGRVVAASALAGDRRVDVSRLVPGVYHFALLRDGVMAGGRAFVKL